MGFVETNVSNSYLPGWEVNRDHEGGSSRARPFHCTPVGLTPAISPNVGDSTVQFVLVEICVRAKPCKKGDLNIYFYQIVIVKLQLAI